MTTLEQLVAAEAEWQRVMAAQPRNAIDHAAQRHLTRLETKIAKLRKQLLAERTRQ